MDTERHDGIHHETGLRMVSVVRMIWSACWVDAISDEVERRATLAHIAGEERDPEIPAHRYDEWDMDWIDHQVARIDAAERRWLACSPDARRASELAMKDDPYDWELYADWCEVVATTAEAHDRRGRPRDE